MRFEFLLYVSDASISLSVNPVRLHLSVSQTITHHSNFVVDMPLEIDLDRAAATPNKTPINV
jgi:hypothetical protein